MRPKLIRNNSISIQDIELFEKKINKALPDGYKSFLLETNGGVIDDAYYRNFYYNNSDSIYIHQFFELDRILSEPDAGENEFNKNWIAIAEDGDSGYIFLSLDKADYGKIYYCDIVHDDINKDSIFLSKDFETLINNLEKDPSISDLKYLAENRSFRELNNMFEKGLIDSNYIDSSGDLLFNIILRSSPPKNEWNKSEYKGKFNEACILIKNFYTNGLDISKVDLICHMDIIEYILSLGFNIDQKDYLNQTTLMKISAKGFPSGVEYLLSKKADPTLKNNNNQTALDIAIEMSKTANKNTFERFQKTINILRDYISNNET